MPGAAGQRGYGKAAGVAVAVQHALKLQAARIGGKLLAAVALVQVKAGFVAFRDIQAQHPVVLGNRDAGIARSGQPASRFGQAFKRAHAGVGALVQPRQTGLCQQRLDDDTFPFLGAAA